MSIWKQDRMRDRREWRGCGDRIFQKCGQLGNLDKVNSILLTSSPSSGFLSSKYFFYLIYANLHYFI